MNNKKILAPALLGCLLTSPLVWAENHNSNWYAQSYPNAKFTVSLSGECSGTVTDYISGINLGAYYQTNDDGDVISNYGEKISTNASVYTSGGFSISGYAYSKLSGESFVETLKAGKRISTINMTTPYQHNVSVSSLAYSSFINQFTCKGGKTLSQVLGSYSPYIDFYDISNKFKTQAQIVVMTDTPNEGTFSLKQTLTGQLRQSSICTGQRPADTTSYSLKCNEAKKIKIKISVNAKGKVSKS